VGEFFLIVGLLFLTAFVFVVWLCINVAGMVVRALFGPRRHASHAPPVLPQGWSACAHAGCRAANPGHARFCSRCGSAVGVVRMRYVA
jgi:hypothetical protein